MYLETEIMAYVAVREEEIYKDLRRLVKKDDVTTKTSTGFIVSPMLVNIDLIKSSELKDLILRAVQTNVELVYFY